MGRRVAWWPILLSLAIVFGGCWATPPAPDRLLAEVPADPAPLLWPERDLSHDPFVPLPDAPRLEHLGCFGLGHLYTHGASNFRGSARSGENLVFLTTDTEPRGNFSGLNLVRDGVPVGTAKHCRPPVNLRVLEPNADSPVGTLVQILSYARWSDQERAITNEFIRDGWKVVLVWPSEETWQESALFDVDLDDIEASAQSIAYAIDNYFADVACAAEACLDYVAQTDSAIHSRPLVLVGSSVGAVCLPAVAARLRETGPHAPDAAVLIAGGTDLFRIICTSPITRDRFSLSKTITESASDCVSFSFDVPLDDTERETLFATVLRRSQLDPEHTAPALDEVPVLQLHAAFDAIIDAPFGDRLYQRLGRPERWSYALGHTGLFFILPFEADDIAWWVHQHVPAAAPSTPSPSAALP